MTAADWKRKDAWTRRHPMFTVEVTRHGEEVFDGGCFDSEGPNRWCVYAYIFSKHPLFATFDGDALWQPATGGLPLHGGCSFLAYVRDATGAPVTAKVGADYNHLHDSDFTRAADQEDAYEVFADAERLFDWLTARAVTPQPAEVAL